MFYQNKINMNNDKQKMACVIRACSSTSSSANNISNTPFTNLESALPNLDVEYIDDNHQLIADSNRKNINNIVIYNNEDHQLIDDNLLQGLSECKIDTPILSHYNLHHPMHEIYSQNEGTKLEKNVDSSKSIRNERTSSANKDHAARRKVSKNRIKRQRREFSDKLQELQNIIPHSRHKKDHASILDDAAEYIKYLKLQNEMLELSEERQLHQVPYVTSTYIPETIDRNEPTAWDIYNYKLVP